MSKTTTITLKKKKKWKLPKPKRSHWILIAFICIICDALRLYCGFHDDDLSSGEKTLSMIMNASIILIYSRDIVTGDYKRYDSPIGNLAYGNFMYFCFYL